MYKNNQNNQIFFPSDFNPNDYISNYRAQNYGYSLTSPDAKMKMGQKNTMIKYNNPKSPSYTIPKTPNYNNTKSPLYYNPKSPNYINSVKYNNNTYNKINNNKIITNVPNSFSQKNNNNIIIDNKIMKIQERFDIMKNKIKNIQNNIINKEPTKNLIQNNNNDLIINNNYQYLPKFNNNTYNTRFEKNNIINNNNINSPKLKDLNEIHNHMQNVNPRSSLIKRMTGYRTSKINVTNNRINNNISKNNVNINNNLYKNTNNNNNSNIQKRIINYKNMINIPKNNNNFRFNQYKTNYNFENDFNNNTYLNQFDINNYPHEVDQINDLDDMDINNKTFNFGDTKKFKNEFLLSDTNYNNYNNYNKKYNNNYIQNNINLNKNKFQINKNTNNNAKNNVIQKANNNFNNINKRKPQVLGNYNNNNKYNDKIIKDINNNIEINSKLNSNVNKNDIEDEESSENLSDIAEEILDTFQSNTNNENNYLIPNLNIENKIEYNNNIGNIDFNQLDKKDNLNEIKLNNNIDGNQIQNKINNLDNYKINSFKINDNLESNILLGKEAGIQTSIFPNNNEALYPEKNLDNKDNKKKIETIALTTNLNNRQKDIDKGAYLDNSNENKNFNKIIDNKKENNLEQKEPIISNNNTKNNTINNINNNINNINNKNNDDSNNECNQLKQEYLMDKNSFVQNINNLNIMKSLIIINSNETNPNNDNKIQSLKDIKSSDINLNNFDDNNMIKEPISNNSTNQISNSNIVLNISYSRDSQAKNYDIKENISKNSPEIEEKKLEKEVQKLEEPNKPTRPNEQKSIIKKIYEETQNKEKEALKKNRRVQINLDNNKYFHYKIDSALFDCYEVYNKNEDLIKFGKENDIMDLEQYMKILKDKKNLKPAIKKYHKDSIKIDKDYKYAENLSERDIIPDLYEEEEEDIRSLEKSLERSIDKSFDKSYDKWYGQSYNDKVNEEYNSCSGMNVSESYDNNTGRNIINKLQEMFIEEVDEEQNEENEIDENVNDKEKLKKD